MMRFISWISLFCCLWTLDGLLAQEINYCKKSPCINGICRSYTHGFQCICNPGWEGVTCTKDVDECQTGLSLCHSKATCLNTDGSYSCSCIPGYKGDGFTCIEINYCKKSPCKNGHCRSLPYGYECMCNPGWEGITCNTDFDECEMGYSLCHPNAACLNTEGSYTCVCNTGYKGDGFNCKKKKFCKKHPCINGRCQDGLDGFECICNPGWEGVTCEKDINECLSNPCSNGATCNNLANSYSCCCKPGYAGRFCETVIDGCLSSPCHNGATCQNLVNGFSCSCNPGYSGIICEIDIDECVSSPCAHGTCSNTLGSYRCVCFDGWTGLNCETDIYDACLSNPCRNGAMCNDLSSGFSCFCRPGYTGKYCEIDINDCMSDSCKNGGICIDKVNDFSCKCPVNWTGISCTTDVDECHTKLNKCHLNSTCVNTNGSYNCICNPGYKGNGFICKEDRLFDYKGDIKITQRSRDFTSPLINISIGFPFGSKFYSKLYFSDNGIIAFQRHSYDTLLSMRYPYTHFSNKDTSTTPMIAVFWADVDVSTGIGDIYYQVYDFLKTPLINMTFKRDLEREVKTYFNPVPTFHALWAIKITWENVPPYPALYFTKDETNTYQAILVTNGIYSFCLMRFDECGMKWKYFALPTNHLPKMGYFSGDFTYPMSQPNFPSFNDPQTEPTVSLQQRYTPDQYIGYNTNKTGMWAYKLEYNTADTINPWQQCLRWYYSEPEPSWSVYTHPCPCSWGQAGFDSSFTSSSRLQDYGFQLKNTESFYSIQNAFNSERGGGTRCYYRRNGALIYGEKERYLPIPWAYGPNVSALREQYRVNEVDPYNKCCRDSGSISLCAMYREKRPIDNCYGYIPPNTGFLYGDPHISTLDGVRYTFNGLGEFILSNIKDENSTVIFRLQGRTARVGNATYFVGLAAEIDRETKVDDIISYNLQFQIEWTVFNSNSTALKINGSVHTLGENATYIKKAILERTTQNAVKATFAGGISLTVSAKLGILNFVTTLMSSYQNRTEGLLGVFNGDKFDDFTSANGSVLVFNAVKIPKESLIFKTGMTWKTTPLDSIFSYNSTEGESWETYNNNSFVPKFYEELLLTSDPTMIQKANDTCKGNNECIYDILSTRDFSVGEATLESVNSYTQQSSTMDNFPPNITGPSTISTKLNKSITVYYTATDKNNDTVVFSLQTDSFDININESGALVWNPTSSVPIYAIVQANDSQTVSEITLTLVLCNCSNNGSCLYDQTTFVKNSRNFMVTGCNCNTAWTGMYCDVNFDICLENNCFNESTCQDRAASEEGFTCGPCPDSLIGDGVDCYDLNECYLNIRSCEHICINILGGYNCSCNAGYSVNELNRSKCDDIDECAQNPTTLCAENAACKNLPGSYTCQCNTGYEGNPHLLCTDVNECSDSNSTICPTESICLNTNGSFMCDCLPGYSGTSCIENTSAETTVLSIWTPNTSSMKITRKTLPSVNSSATLLLGETNTSQSRFTSSATINITAGPSRPSDNQFILINKLRNTTTPNPTYNTFVPSSNLVESTIAVTSKPSYSYVTVHTAVQVTTIDDATSETTATHSSLAKHNTTFTSMPSSTTQSITKHNMTSADFVTSTVPVENFSTVSSTPTGSLVQRTTQGIATEDVTTETFVTISKSYRHNTTATSSLSDSQITLNVPTHRNITDNGAFETIVTHSVPLDSKSVVTSTSTENQEAINITMQGTTKNYVTYNTSATSSMAAMYNTVLTSIPAESQVTSNSTIQSNNTDNARVEIYVTTLSPVGNTSTVASTRTASQVTLTAENLITNNIALESFVNSSFNVDVTSAVTSIPPDSQVTLNAQNLITNNTLERFVTSSILVDVTSAVTSMSLDSQVTLKAQKLIINNTTLESFVTSSFPVDVTSAVTSIPPDSQVTLKAQNLITNNTTLERFVTSSFPVDVTSAVTSIPPDSQVTLKAQNLITNNTTLERFVTSSFPVDVTSAVTSIPPDSQVTLKAQNLITNNATLGSFVTSSFPVDVTSAVTSIPPESQVTLNSQAQSSTSDNMASLTFRNKSYPVKNSSSEASTHPGSSVTIITPMQSITTNNAELETLRSISGPLENNNTLTSTHSDIYLSLNTKNQKSTSDGDTYETIETNSEPATYNTTLTYTSSVSQVIPVSPTQIITSEHGSPATIVKNSKPATTNNMVTSEPSNPKVTVNLTTKSTAIDDAQYTIFASTLGHDEDSSTTTSTQSDNQVPINMTDKAISESFVTNSASTENNSSVTLTPADTQVTQTSQGLSADNTKFEKFGTNLVPLENTSPANTPLDSGVSLNSSTQSRTLYNTIHVTFQTNSGLVENTSTITPTFMDSLVTLYTPKHNMTTEDATSETFATSSVPVDNSSTIITTLSDIQSTKNTMDNVTSEPFETHSSSSEISSTVSSISLKNKVAFNTTTQSTSAQSISVLFKPQNNWTTLTSPIQSTIDNASSDIFVTTSGSENARTLTSTPSHSQLTLNTTIQIIGNNSASAKHTTINTSLPPESKVPINTPDQRITVVKTTPIIQESLNSTIQSTTDDITSGILGTTLGPVKYVSNLISFTTDNQIALNTTMQRTTIDNTISKTTLIHFPPAERNTAVIFSPSDSHVPLMSTAQSKTTENVSSGTFGSSLTSFENTHIVISTPSYSYVTLNTTIQNISVEHATDKKITTSSTLPSQKLTGTYKQSESLLIINTTVLSTVAETQFRNLVSSSGPVENSTAVTLTPSHSFETLNTITQSNSTYNTESEMFVTSSGPFKNANNVTFTHSVRQVTLNTSLLGTATGTTTSQTFAITSGPVENATTLTSFISNSQVTQNTTIQTTAMKNATSENITSVTSLQSDSQVTMSRTNQSKNNTITSIPSDSQVTIQRTLQSITTEDIPEAFESSSGPDENNSILTSTPSHSQLTATPIQSTIADNEINVTIVTSSTPFTHNTTFPSSQPERQPPINTTIPSITIVNSLSRNASTVSSFTSNQETQYTMTHKIAIYNTTSETIATSAELSTDNNSRMTSISENPVTLNSTIQSRAIDYAIYQTLATAEHTSIVTSVASNSLVTLNTTILRTIIDNATSKSILTNSEPENINTLTSTPLYTSITLNTTIKSIATDSITSNNLVTLNTKIQRTIINNATAKANLTDSAPTSHNTITTSSPSDFPITLTTIAQNRTTENTASETAGSIENTNTLTSTPPYSHVTLNTTIKSFATDSISSNYQVKLNTTIQRAIIDNPTSKATLTDSKTATHNTIITTLPSDSQETLKLKTNSITTLNAPSEIVGNSLSPIENTNTVTSTLPFSRVTLNTTIQRIATETVMSDTIVISSASANHNVTDSPSESKVHLSTTRQSITTISATSSYQLTLNETIHKNITNYTNFKTTVQSPSAAVNNNTVTPLPPESQVLVKTTSQRFTIINSLSSNQATINKTKQKTTIDGATAKITLSDFSPAPHNTTFTLEPSHNNVTLISTSQSKTINNASSATFGSSSDAAENTNTIISTPSHTQLSLNTMPQSNTADEHSETIGTSSTSKTHNSAIPFSIVESQLPINITNPSIAISSATFNNSSTGALSTIVTSSGPATSKTFVTTSASESQITLNSTTQSTTTDKATFETLGMSSDPGEKASTITPFTSNKQLTLKTIQNTSTDNATFKSTLTYSVPATHNITLTSSPSDNQEPLLSIVHSKTTENAPSSTYKSSSSPFENINTVTSTSHTQLTHNVIIQSITTDNETIMTNSTPVTLNTGISSSPSENQLSINTTGPSITNNQSTFKNTGTDVAQNTMIQKTTIYNAAYETIITSSEHSKGNLTTSSSDSQVILNSTFQSSTTDNTTSESLLTTPGSGGIASIVTSVASNNQATLDNATSKPTLTDSAPATHNNITTFSPLDTQKPLTLITNSITSVNAPSLTFGSSSLSHTQLRLNVTIQSITTDNELSESIVTSSSSATHNTTIPFYQAESQLPINITSPSNTIVNATFKNVSTDGYSTLGNQVTQNRKIQKTTLNNVPSEITVTGSELGTQNTTLTYLPSVSHSTLNTSQSTTKTKQTSATTVTTSNPPAYNSSTLYTSSDVHATLQLINTNNVTFEFIVPSTGPTTHNTTTYISSLPLDNQEHAITQSMITDNATSDNQKPHEKSTQITIKNNQTTESNIHSSIPVTKIMSVTSTPLESKVAIHMAGQSTTAFNARFETTVTKSETITDSAVVIFTYSKSQIALNTTIQGKPTEQTMHVINKTSSTPFTNTSTGHFASSYSQLTQNTTIERIIKNNTSLETTLTGIATINNTTVTYAPLGSYATLNATLQRTAIENKISETLATSVTSNSIVTASLESQVSFKTPIQYITKDNVTSPVSDAKNITITSTPSGSHMTLDIRNQSSVLDIVTLKTPMTSSASLTHSSNDLSTPFLIENTSNQNTNRTPEDNTDIVSPASATHISAVTAASLNTSSVSSGIHLSLNTTVHSMKTENTTSAVYKNQTTLAGTAPSSDFNSITYTKTGATQDNTTDVTPGKLATSSSLTQMQLQSSVTNATAIIRANTSPNNKVTMNVTTQSTTVDRATSVGPTTSARTSTHTAINTNKATETTDTTTARTTNDTTTSAAQTTTTIRTATTVRTTTDTTSAAKIPGITTATTTRTTNDTPTSTAKTSSITSASTARTTNDITTNPAKSPIIATTARTTNVITTSAAKTTVRTTTGTTTSGAKPSSITSATTARSSIDTTTSNAKTPNITIASMAKTNTDTITSASKTSSITSSTTKKTTNAATTSDTKTHSIIIENTVRSTNANTTSAAKTHSITIENTVRTTNATTTSAAKSPGVNTATTARTTNNSTPSAVKTPGVITATTRSSIDTTPTASKTPRITTGATVRTTPNTITRTVKTSSGTIATTARNTTPIITNAITSRTTTNTTISAVKMSSITIITTARNTTDTTIINAKTPSISFATTAKATTDNTQITAKTLSIHSKATVRTTSDTTPTAAKAPSITTASTVRDTADNTAGAPKTSSITFATSVSTATDITTNAAKTPCITTATAARTTADTTNTRTNAAINPINASTSAEKNNTFTTTSAVKTPTIITATTVRNTSKTIITTISSARSTTITTTSAARIPTTTSTTLAKITTTSVTMVSGTSTNMLKAVALFDYGEGVGDTQFVLRKFDFNSPLFQPEIGFPFGNKLRKSLYYTDNGQIIFPVSINNIFSYTNPPASGFTASFNVPMIAVFWDDADFSNNVGTTYYQEYTRESSGNNDAVIQTVESMVQKNMKTSYTAQWTLKVTWVNVPAYPAKQNDNRTNTYQVVLTTDGHVSYILMLYKDGGMNWNVSNRISNVIIGYSSGQVGFLKNDDIMQKPAGEKYRPCDYVGPNSDLRGLWIYSLNSAALENYREKCLNWFNAEPPPSQWNSGLLSCPCLYQQGLADFRYRPTTAGQSVSLIMLRSTSPSQFKAGVRCLYNLKKQFSEGFQERSYIFTPSVPDAELQPYDWCCSKVEDPQFCDMYKKRRPSISCGKYKPLSPGWMYGDPHITTLDQLSYTFNGLGDFLLLNASTSGTSIILQGRTAQTGSAMATNFVAFAVQYISSTASVKVEWYLAGNGDIHVLLNGKVVSYSFSAEMVAEINNTNPAVFLLKNNTVTAVIEGLFSISVSAFFGILTSITSLPPQFINKTQGLLGVWNFNKDDDFLQPDGTIISISSTEEDIFNYAMTWEVINENLFTILPAPRSSNFTPVFLNDLITTNSAVFPEVLTQCANNTQCIYDTLSTGNLTLGLFTQQISENFQVMNESLNSIPPDITGESIIEAFSMEKVQKQYSASGTGIQFTVYTSLDLNVTDTGLLTWMPSSAQGFTFQLEAVNSHNLSSVFQLTFIVCSCLLRKECEFHQITRVNGTSLYVASCTCISNYSGNLCQDRTNPCDQGCFSGVTCDPYKGCGPCPLGLTGDGLHCADIDECSQRNPCSSLADCTNTLQSYTCTCKLGFTGNGTHCEDLNECLTYPCSPNAACTNTNGSYLCECIAGFTGDGKQCDDINACLAQPCSANAICNNTVGSFSCSCKAGFTGDGLMCTVSCGSCEQDYCGNGQPCTRAGDACTQQCHCHPSFTDSRCIIAGNSFIPEASPNTPRRTVYLRMRSNRSITAEQANNTVVQLMGKLKVHRFESCSSFVFYQQLNSFYYVKLTAYFTYNGDINVITFLNEQLVSAIKTFIPTTLRLATTAAADLALVSVRDGQYYTVEELMHYFPCNIYGYQGYTLNQETFTCESICKDYCKNNGNCQHLKDEIICRCVPFGIYTTSGHQCEILSMNLNAFFGILFGALAFLFLLLLGIGLGIYFCQKKKNQKKDAESCEKPDIFQTKNPLSSFKKQRETIPSMTVSPTEPHLIHWRPRMENIYTLMELPPKSTVIH